MQHKTQVQLDQLFTIGLFLIQIEKYGPSTPRAKHGHLSIEPSLAQTTFN